MTGSKAAAQLGNVHPGIANLRPYQPGKPVDELAR